MNKIDEKVDELREILKATEVDELKRMNYRLSDAIRGGSTVTEHCQSGWGNGDTACALSAAVIDAKARGYL